MNKFVAMSACALIACAIAGCKSSEETESTSGEVMINETCPVCPGKASAAHTVKSKDGQTVGCCCDSCAKQFESLTEEGQAKAISQVK